MTSPSPTFGHQVVAAAPYTVVIDYGDGDVYGNDQDHLAAVFGHTYTRPGAFLVTAAVTDAAGQVATASCTYTWAAPAPAPRPVPAPQPAPAPVPAPQPEADAHYQNCDAVRAAGAAPIRSGDPGWQPKFDRDGDGVGCE